MEEILEAEVSEKKGVKITKDDYSLNLSITRNGYHWTSVPVDDELLKMILKVVNRHYGE